MLATRVAARKAWSAVNERAIGVYTIDAQQGTFERKKCKDWDGITHLLSNSSTGKG